MKSFFLSAFLLLPFIALTQPGTLDPTFGNGGLVRTDVGPGDHRPSRLAVQADGRILCVGYAGGRSVIVRYLTDGSIDDGFGTSGVCNFSVPTYNQLVTLAVQPDGRIVAAGSSGADNQIMVVRVGANGISDAGFGSNGVALLPSPFQANFPHDIALQGDGKIVVCGSASQGGQSSAVVYRITTTGLLDTDFSDDGIFDVRPGGYTEQYAGGIVVQNDGKILMSGYYDMSIPNDRYVFRLTTAGELDPSFGTDGIVILDGVDLSRFEESSDLLLEASGRILVVGSYFRDIYEDHVTVTAVSPDGTVDATYGTNGTASSAQLGHVLHAAGSCLGADGRAVVAASLQISGTGSGWRTQVHRFNTNGSVDTGFGTDGYADGPIPAGGLTNITDVAAQADGNLLACGRLDSVIAVVRLDGSPASGIAEEAASRAALNVRYDGNAQRITVSSATPWTSGALLSVYDISGKLLLTRTATATTTLTLDTSTWSVGVYSISVRDTDGERTGRFVKDR